MTWRPSPRHTPAPVFSPSQLPSLCLLSWSLYLISVHQLLSPALSPPSALSHLAVIIADDYAFCGSQVALGIRSVFLVPSEPGTWLGASWVVGSGLGEGGDAPHILGFYGNQANSCFFWSHRLRAPGNVVVITSHMLLPVTVGRLSALASVSPVESWKGL